jgi:AcrR family transcriptional regulator
MLETAVELVGESGLTVGLEHLSYEVVIQRADVARSAVYRVWPTKEVFFEDLLLELAAPSTWQGTGAFDQATLDLAVATVVDRVDQLSTVVGRREALLEAARLGAKRNFEALAETPHWRTYVALTATVTSLPNSDVKTKLQAKLQESEGRFLVAMAEFYTSMAHMLGYRLKPAFRDDFALLAAMGAAVIEGLGLRQIIAPEIVSKTFQMRAFGGREDVEWTVPALGFTAIVDAMIEPDPDYDASTLTKAYIKELSEKMRTRAEEILPR